MRENQIFPTLQMEMNPPVWVSSPFNMASQVDWFVICNALTDTSFMSKLNYKFLQLWTWEEKPVLHGQVLDFDDSSARLTCFPGSHDREKVYVLRDYART